MKLTTEIGQIELPCDFALTMKRNNPLLNGEGDFSVPTKLPSSTNNLNAISHLERIDRANKYINKLDAILEVGPVRKRGQLAIDTVHPHEGIDASFGIDNSDLYAKAKKKTLKEIFGDHRLAFFASSQAAFEKLQGVYEGIYWMMGTAIRPSSISIITRSAPMMADSFGRHMSTKAMSTRCRYHRSTASLLS